MGFERAIVRSDCEFTDSKGQPALITWESGWGEIPASVEVRDIPAIAVNDEFVFLFVRGADCIVRLTHDGAYVDLIGEGNFVRPHGISINADGNLVCVDDEGNQVVVLSSTGEVLRRISGPNRSAETGYVPGFPHTVLKGVDPFCYPTHAHEENGQMLVSDGYGNSRLHRFDDQDRLVKSWGEPGDLPGQFVIPHGLLALKSDGRYAVCDRENERIQWFDSDDRFMYQWGGFNCPNNIAQLPNGDFAVTELGRRFRHTHEGAVLEPEGLAPRLTIRDSTGALLDEGAPLVAGEVDVFFSPHGLAVDSKGTIYVGEVRTAFPEGLAPSGGNLLHRVSLGT